MQKDLLFSEKNQAIGDFDFGEKTAEVFDDMLDRSIPMYRELQRMLGEIANEFAAEKTHVYDLGCSTGTTLETLHTAIDKNIRLIGLDYSEPMLNRARERFASLIDTNRLQLLCADLNQGCVIENASVVLLNLTLQFIRPLYRDTLIKHIYAGLNDNGCLLVIEKVLGNDSLYNRLFIKFYYEMKKRNGYTAMEISKKRESLENVLIPYRVDENIELLKRNGFSTVEIFFKWYNFCGLLAVKKA